MVILLGQKQAVRVEAADHLRSESSITPGEAPQRQLPPPPHRFITGGVPTSVKHHRTGGIPVGEGAACSHTHKSLIKGKFLITTMGNPSVP